MVDIFLEKFSIHGLNGDLDVDLDIIDNKKILVSENGMGKTTILGIFYAFFKRSRKINQYDFNYIILKLRGSNQSYIFSKGLLSIIFDKEFFVDVSSITEEDFERFYTELNSIRVSLNKIDGNNEYDDDKKFNSLVLSSFIYFYVNDEASVRRIFQDVGYNNDRSEFRRKSFHYLMQVLNKRVNDLFPVFRTKNLNVNFFEIYKSIVEIRELNEILDFKFLIEWLQELHNIIYVITNNREILYFTTYRVVEKNINNFKKDEDEDDSYSIFGGVEGANELFKDSPLIQFGMVNVKEIWQNLSSEIRTSTTEEFLKLSGTLLKNVVDNKKVEPIDIDNLFENRESITKILSRVDDDTFDSDDKEKLISIIKGKKTLGKNLALFYILQNMVSIYENQKHIDQAINNYCDAINCFFKNKKIIFNDITSEIYVALVGSNKIIDIEDLSSGEKQIISFFTKLYLTNIEKEYVKYWIIYDEPEISLSIEWQMLVLPKILESNRCEFLLSATHSPFIFKNDLRKYVSDLSLEVKGLS